MKQSFERFMTDNSTEMRLLRTIIQGLLGVIVANMDTLIGKIVIDPDWKPFIVACVMAVLSPVMSEIGKKGEGHEF